MDPDISIDNIDYDQVESVYSRHPDTLSPSWTGDGQEIPVVVVTPQDTLNTELRESSLGLPFKNAKKVDREMEVDEKYGDVIKPVNKDDDNDDDGDCDDNNGGKADEEDMDTELQKMSQKQKRRRKLLLGDVQGSEAGIRSRMDIILGKIKLQKELLDKLRYQPWHIQKKLKLLSKAKTFLRGHQDKLSKRQDYHQKSIEAFRRLHRELINIASFFIPWEMRIKKVESHFGSVVASYFLFLRWILGINSFLTLLTVAFIIIPQMTVGHTSTSDMIPNPEKTKSKDLETLFNAEGIIKYSAFFYGHYDNKMIGHGYMMPLAYLVTGLVVYGLSIIIVLRKMASNLRLNKIATKDEQFSFSWKVFNSWDYMVGHTETANNKYAAITTAFKESIREVEEKQKVEKKNLLIFLRVLGCILTLALLIASGYLTFLVVMLSSSNTNPNQNFFELNQTTWVITAIFIVFPNFFDLISAMEQYHPRTNLRVQLARVFILNFLNVTTLMYSLYQKIIDSQCPSSVNSTAGSKYISNGSDVKGRLTSTQLPSVWTPAIYNASTNAVTLTTTTASGTDCKPLKCWETYVGQEVYKITVLDLLMTIIMILLQDFLRGLFIRCCNSRWCWNLEKTFPEYPEFKTAENILHLINNQGMIWLGWFFSPGISVMNLVKLVVLAYVRFWSVLVCNVPEKRIFRASRSNNFYYTLLLIMLFICCIPSMIVFFNKYSIDCGPFRDIHNIMDLFVKNSPFVAEILKFASKPATSLVLLGSFSLIIYYLWSASQSIKEVSRDLKKTLEYERTEGKKKVYAIADANRTRDATAELAQSATVMSRTQIKDERKTVNPEVRTTKRTADGSKKPKPKSTLEVLETRENPEPLPKEEAKLYQVVQKSLYNSKQLSLRSVTKEAQRLRHETQLGEIKLAKLKKFQLDREIKRVEKRILKWQEQSKKDTLTETSFHTLSSPEGQQNLPHRHRKSEQRLPDNPQTQLSKTDELMKNKKEFGVLNQTIPVPDVSAHCSREMPEQRKLKHHVACREKRFVEKRNVLKEKEKEEKEEEDEGEGGEEDEEEDTQVSYRKYPVDVFPEPRHTSHGYDNQAFVVGFEGERKIRQSHLRAKPTNWRQQDMPGERRMTNFDGYYNDSFHRPRGGDDGSDEE